MNEKLKMKGRPIESMQSKCIGFERKTVDVFEVGKNVNNLTREVSWYR